MPELLERVLGRHKQDFFAGRGVQQQVAARLVYAREVEECRFLYYLVPGLHKGLLGTRLDGHACNNAERIERIEHRLAAFLYKFLEL